MLSSHRSHFCLVGTALAAAVSMGLLLVRALVDEDPLDWSWIVREINDELLTYGYVTGTTFLAGLVLGWLIGNKTDQLQTMSLIDPLTGLANRRGFRASTSTISNRSTIPSDTKQATPAFVTSPRAFARAVARFGGDEFVLVLPSTGALEAQELAKRIRQTLAAQAQIAQTNCNVSVSIGITDLRRAETVHGDALVAAADAALYRAKAEGRDRVVLSPEPSAAAQHMARPPPTHRNPGSRAGPA
ncbi:GGDEF-domain-containing protein [Rickenella mellea]|uniref:GGDEF-domain-containing protein n=1 Tax=Rickenella mellea TaxID=50990 RepID=A0A4Y7QL02_9AGAM|nr:GGDEF-domain-containing protein [Rickenella mellea]